MHTEFWAANLKGREHSEFVGVEVKGKGKVAMLN
jgi:hypothetical protein